MDLSAASRVATQPSVPSTTGSPHTSGATDLLSVPASSECSSSNSDSDAQSPLHAIDPFASSMAAASEVNLSAGTAHAMPLTMATSSSTYVEVALGAASSGLNFQSAFSPFLSSGAPAMPALAQAFSPTSQSSLLQSLNSTPSFGP